MAEEQDISAIEVDVSVVSPGAFVGLSSKAIRVDLRRTATRRRRWR